MDEVARDSWDRNVIRVAKCIDDAHIAISFHESLVAVCASLPKEPISDKADMINKDLDNNKTEAEYIAELDNAPNSMGRFGDLLGMIRMLVAYSFSKPVTTMPTFQKKIRNAVESLDLSPLKDAVVRNEAIRILAGELKPTIDAKSHESIATYIQIAVKKVL